MSATVALCLHAASCRCCGCCPAADRQIIVPETSESPQSRKRTWRSPNSLSTAAGFFTLSRARQEPPPPQSLLLSGMSECGCVLARILSRSPPRWKTALGRLLRGHRRLSEGEPDVETPRGSPSAPAPPLTSSVPFTKAISGGRRRWRERWCWEIERLAGVVKPPEFHTPPLNSDSSALTSS